MGRSLPILSTYPGTLVAVLSVEDTHVPMRVFFLSVSLRLITLCRGGEGTWLHARGTHVACRGEQCPRGEAVCGGGAGQGAPSLLSEFTPLLTSEADLPLAGKMQRTSCPRVMPFGRKPSASIIRGICVHGLTLFFSKQPQRCLLHLPTSPGHLAWDTRPPSPPASAFLTFTSSPRNVPEALQDLVIPIPNA